MEKTSDSLRLYPVIFDLKHFPSYSSVDTPTVCVSPRLLDTCIVGAKVLRLGVDAGL